MAPTFKDLVRIANGISLIAQEATKRSEAISAAKSGDLGTLVSKTLKNALVTATDLAGFTSGEPRQISNPKPKESVVYFSDPPQPESGPTIVSRSDPTASPISVEGKIEDVEVHSELRVSSTTTTKNGEKEADLVLNSSKGVSSNTVTNSERNDVSFIVNSNEGVSSTTITNNGDLAATLNEESKDSGASEQVAVKAPLRKRRPRERRVPSTPLTRALGFAGLGAGLAWGTIQESAKRIVYGTPNSSENQSALSPFLSEKNAERMALALCRMRGAALKIGQMLSIQDESLVPAPILAALDIVRQGADAMPRSQLNDVLDAELGHDWSSKLRSFDYEPLAAASIGQVHRAIMRDGMEIAMKIQYPGVADSIESDIENVRLLLDYTNLIPEGLYLDRAIKVAKEELSRECDYRLEATNQKRFHELLSSAEGFYVPLVIDEISSRKVLTTELVAGVPIDKVALLNQKIRDYVGKKLLDLTLKELFVFRFMQTDPNWGNFLYDDTKKMINLIDFGAARDYPQNFVDDYLRMVIACANRDREAVITMSRRLGFITGEESEVMLDAHVQAGFIVGLPFSEPGGYDFRGTNITRSISSLGATMLRHRLTPPPDEAYSLHRKLSGAFLACIKLGAVVPCREMLLQIYQQYQFSDDDAEFLATSIV